MNETNPAFWPAFCCAIMRDEHGRYLLEQRPRDASSASGQITCFGGSREVVSPIDRMREETPGECLIRELREELGYEVTPEMLRLSVRLINAGPLFRFRSGRHVAQGGVLAWFYRVEAPAASSRLVTEPGYSIVWLEPGELPRVNLSRWHAVALEADAGDVDEAQVTHHR